MNDKKKAILASYGRSFLVAIMTAYSMGKSDWRDLLVAGVVAIVGPAIRAINPNDPAFGLIADEANKAIDKLAKADKKKATKKKA